MPLTLSRFRSFALTLFCLTTVCAQSLAQTNWVARTSPAWLKQGTVYEIFPRNFSNSGDFNGITSRLNDLQDLGVTVLWLMPIHSIGEKMKKGTVGSPYAVKDYYAINPDYGTAADLRRLVSESHQRGLKVILDLVANHTAWDSVMMAHPEFYKHDDSGRIIPPVPEWSDVAGLDYTNPALRDYMIAMLKYWVKDFDVDGFRCDVASMVPTDFWNRARSELVRVKPDIMMLAEASKPELLLNAFDVDYAWPLHATLNQVMLQGAPASELRSCWEKDRREFPRNALHLRITDNHDEARAVARFGIKGALATEAMMFAMDGVPLLYNGMEVGDATESGDPALFEKLPIFWSPKERPPLREIYRALIRLRKQYAAFTSDQLVWVENSDSADVVSFIRSDANDAFVFVVNLSNRPVTTVLTLDRAEDFKPFKIAGLSETTDSLPRLKLGGFEFRLFHRSMK